MDVYDLINQKGGVGKTANTIGLGGALAEAGERVLLVDLDPQGHLTEALGVAESPDEATLKMAMLGEWSGDVRELVAQYRPRLHVVPTNLDAFLLDRGLYMSTGREHRLARLLETLEDDYDVCLIDCPPSLGASTDAALMAGRRRPGRGGGLIVPVEAEDSSIRALRLLLRQVGTLGHVMGVDLDVVGLVPSRVDTRDGAVVTSTLEAFRNLGEPPVIAEIKKRKEIREAWRARLPVTEYAPDSEAAGWYRDLAKAVRR
ncbi:chromosome partitioning protein [Streptomonospora salina]|uniref:Chromosome partitioning protein n=1 Tax=Streptomonospora salina TaxID=104205 RepID=A0A841EPK4_9ACTN|nr:ParA family protein [Streptomonospora salina]MBB6001361.1 chromosome partitioning protein [Streptomonospora salina]